MDEAPKPSIAKLSIEHDPSAFDCGHKALNTFIRLHALPGQRANASQTYVAVVGPAMGGIIPAYETARHLGVPAVWTEREGGEMRLRRFELKPGARVVIIEDIVTTGLSSRETVAALTAIGAEVVAVACLIDRSAGKADCGVPLVALAEYEVPAYPADALPPELAALPAVKPGSRNI